MLTILAWAVFVPATIWNILLWTVGMWFTFVDPRSDTVDVKRSLVEVIISLAIWFIPGVYLFGW